MQFSIQILNKHTPFLLFSGGFSQIAGLQGQNHFEFLNLTLLCLCVICKKLAFDKVFDYRSFHKIYLLDKQVQAHQILRKSYI